MRLPAALLFALALCTSVEAQDASIVISQAERQAIINKFNELQRELTTLERENDALRGEISKLRVKQGCA